MTNFLINNEGDNQWYLVPMLANITYISNLMLVTDPSYTTTPLSIFIKGDTYHPNTQFSQLRNMNPPFPPAFWKQIGHASFSDILLKDIACWVKVNVGLNSGNEDFFGLIQNWDIGSLAIGELSVDQIHSKKKYSRLTHDDITMSDKEALEFQLNIAKNSSDYAGVIYFTDIDTNININSTYYLLPSNDILYMGKVMVCRWSSWATYSRITNSDIKINTYNTDYWNNQYNSPPTTEADKNGSLVAVNRVVWLKSQYIKLLVSGKIDTKLSDDTTAFNDMQYNTYHTNQSSNEGRSVYGYTSWISGWGPYLSQPGTNNFLTSVTTNPNLKITGISMENVKSSSSSRKYNIDYFFPQTFSDDITHDNTDKTTIKRPFNALGTLTGPALHTFTSTGTITPTPGSTVQGAEMTNGISSSTLTTFNLPSPGGPGGIISGYYFTNQSFSESLTLSCVDSKFYNCHFNNTIFTAESVLNGKLHFSYCYFDNANLNSITFSNILPGYTTFPIYFEKCSFKNTVWNKPSNHDSLFFKNCTPSNFPPWKVNHVAHPLNTSTTWAGHWADIDLDPYIDIDIT